MKNFAYVFLPYASQIHTQLRTTWSQQDSDKTAKKKPMPLIMPPMLWKIIILFKNRSTSFQILRNLLAIEIKYQRYVESLTSYKIYFE